MSFTNVNPAQLGHALSEMKWAGGTVEAAAVQLELTGYTDADFGKSAKGVGPFRVAAWERDGRRRASGTEAL